MKHEENRFNNYSRIMERAVELLRERGLEGVTFEELSESCGLTQRTLFRYFCTKKDLHRCVVAYFLRYLRLRTDLLFSYVLEEEKTGIEMLKEIFDALVEIYPQIKVTLGALQDVTAFLNRNEIYEENMPDGQDAPALLFGAAYDTMPKKKQDEENPPILYKIMQRGIADGSMRPDLDPMQTAYLIRNVAIGMMQQREWLPASKNHDAEMICQICACSTMMLNYVRRP